MENKKQLLLLVAAVVAGILAVGLTSAYVSNTIQGQAQQLKEEADARQKELVGTLQKQSEQKMAALAQEIERAKTEQAQALQRQISDMQARMLDQQKTAAAAAVAKKFKPSLALKTPQGKRAVTVMVNSLAAVGGLLNPGDVVDVIARLSIPAGADLPEDPKTKKPVTAMVFQDLQVLAVNTNLEETGAYYDEQQNAAALKVTVAVDPEEAGLLSFASHNGLIELALRSPQDTDHQMVKASTWKTLADYILQNQGSDIELPDDLKGQKAIKEEGPAKPGIQIFRGGKEL